VIDTTLVEEDEGEGVGVVRREEVDQVAAITAPIILVLLGIQCI